MVFKNIKKYWSFPRIISGLICFILIFQSIFLLCPTTTFAVDIAGPSAGLLNMFRVSKTIKLRTADIKPTVPTSEPKKNARDFLDAMAIMIAQLFVKQIINSTIDWANSGFEGGPAYAINPKGYFINLTDNILGEALSSNGDLRFLCSPFRDAVRISIARTYYQPPRTYYDCPISKVAGNIEDFYQNFDNGGWDAWFEMTQNSSGNPFGAYIIAQGEIATKIQEEVGIAQNELNWNQGFLSWSECIKKDPNTGECLKRGDTKTPGSMIKNELDTTLASELEQFISIQQFDQLLGAILGGLMQKYIFSNKGLFRSDHATDFPEDLSELPNPSDYEGTDSTSTGNGDTSTGNESGDASNPGAGQGGPAETLNE